MLIDRLALSLHHAASWRRVLELLGEGGDASLAASGLIRPMLVATLMREWPRATLVVIAGEEAAERFARQTAAYLPQEQVLRFPERTDLPWADVPPDVAVVSERARALHALSKARPVVVVASARALMRIVPPHGSHVFEPLVLAEGDALDLEEAVQRLSRMGYEREDIASRPGVFAIRGGVLDVYGGDATHPVRAELFGDEIETLKRFVPSTGQTIGPEALVEIYPCRELTLSSRGIAALEMALRDRALKGGEVAHHLELIREGIYFNGIERYMPLLYKRPGAAAEYADPSTMTVVIEPRSLFDDAARRYDELEGLAKFANCRMEGLYLAPAALDFGEHQRVTFLSLLRAGAGVDGELSARRPEVSGGEERFVGGVRSLMASGHGVALAVPDRRARARVGDALAALGVPTEVERDHVTEGEAVRTGALTADVVPLTDVDVPSGYVIPDARLAVVSIDDVYPRSAIRRRARDIDPTRLTFAFAPGDYVVHATHGIALFKEMVRQEVLGVERDYLLLEYAKGDKLYVPVEQLDRVTKYVGPEGSAPRVTRLNTADWSRATKKARSAARKLAFDLVDLYARRATVAGHAYKPDSPWQMEMEAAFPFEETPDQLAAIADVKADMESDTPMDRLICGDVGYGKTEVAIRAAFKTTQDGMQVMVLCPTTILAQQHFTTFSERYAAFPVRVEVLSRFRSPAQQKEALEGFASGAVDVLIGTHRLLSADVTPKKLGLVVIDEEQRFGVEHKEHLKNLREQVDVLTLTATPIPRTLQMSLSGVRDMSVIDTPPPNRFPVQVHVGEYDADVVSGAIRRELERGGQVYFVSNRVRSIDEAVRRVTDAAPEARVAVGHGQLSEHQLERVMESFSAGEIDVLVATTIIESGIDNPHTNTLVIEDSQRLGLAQLYQLKGRVGRSHVKAYAYFMFPRASTLTEQAVERLTALRDHVELGSGIKIAMRDLEIRGAGSLLGAEQSGNVAAVGFDLYAQMLQEAVVEARGEPQIAFPEVRVDLPLAAFLPEEYVSDVDERVRFYRRFAGSPSIEAVDRVADELKDAFGAPPPPARNLVNVARIKARAADAGVTSVTLVRKRLVFAPVELTDAQRGVVAARGAVYQERERKLAVPLDYEASVTEEALGVLDAILTAE